MQTIGERLEEARKRKGISIREAAEATKIRGDYLHKYENNQFDIKLPDIYVRGFLRTYATYLKLPGDKIINDYRALGLSDVAKNSRSLNREVYGRMDISVANAKSGNQADPATVGNVHSAATADTTHGDKNPATFNPRANVGFNVDPNLIIKGAVLLGSIIVLVFLVIWAAGAFKSAQPSSTAANASENITWIRPQPSDRTIGLYATGPVDMITATDANGTLLYRGPLKSGEIRPIPRNNAITVQTETPQSVMIEVGGQQYPLKDSTGQFIKRSTIKAP